MANSPIRSKETTDSAAERLRIGRDFYFSRIEPGKAEATKGPNRIVLENNVIRAEWKTLGALQLRRVNSRISGASIQPGATEFTIVTTEGRRINSEAFEIKLRQLFELPDHGNVNYRLHSPYSDQGIRDLYLPANRSVTIDLEPFDVFVFEALPVRQ